MSLYKKRDFIGQIALLNDELKDWNNWKNPTRTFLIDFLTKAMEATMIEPDVNVEFVSVRSKFQTLKALRDRLQNADKEVAWRQEEIAKLVKEQS